MFFSKIGNIRKEMKEISIEAKGSAKVDKRGHVTRKHDSSGKADGDNFSDPNRYYKEGNILGERYRQRHARDI